MRHLNRDENCSKTLYLYMFKKHGRLSFKELKSQKENSLNSTLKTSRGIKVLSLHMMIFQHFSFSASTHMIGPEGPIHIGVLRSQLFLTL